jgi:hypothetical protein
MLLVLNGALLQPQAAATRTVIRSVWDYD